MTPLPSEYALRSIGDIAEQIRGVSYKKSHATTEPRKGYIPILRAGNIVEDGLCFEDLVYVPQKHVSDAQELRRGDIVVAASSGSIDVIGKAALLRNDWTGSFGAFCKVLRPGREIDSCYLSYFLRTPYYRKTISRLAAGANINNLRNEHLNNLQIPLPPLPEQKRIAAILDKADAIRRKRAQSLKLADEFLKSAFLDMFGDPVTNPKGLQKLELREVCTKITDGTHQSPKWSASGIPFIFVSNISSQGKISFDTRKFINEETWDKLTKRCPIERGDILYTTVGSYGNVAVVNTGRKFAFQRHIAHIKPIKTEIDPYFLEIMLRSPGVRSQVDRMVRGVAQKTLNLSDLNRVMILAPSMAEQAEFLRLLSPAKRNCYNQENTQSLLEDLFASLTQRVFRGDI